MLKSLQKYFTAEAVTIVASATQPKEVSEMTTQETQPNAADNKTAELTAQLATATENITALQTQLTDAIARLDQASAQLATLEVEKESLATKAKAAVQASRKEKLESVIGTAKSEAVLASLESADDATFNTVLGAMAASFEKEAASPAFQEAGISEEARPAAEPDTVAKLAAAIQAQINPK